MNTSRGKKEAPKSRPASTVVGRENQLVSLAVDLAEKQMREGTASAQVISHYLKLGSTRESLEQSCLRAENELLSARVEQLKSGAKMEELYTAAIQAMSTYSGRDQDGYDD